MSLTDTMVTAYDRLAAARPSRPANVRGSDAMHEVLALVVADSGLDAAELREAADAIACAMGGAITNDAKQGTALDLRAILTTAVVVGAVGARLSVDEAEAA